MLWICTAKETTLAIGSSVPVTNAGPVSTVGGTGTELLAPPPEQPVATDVAAAKKARAKGKILSCVLESITIKSSLIWCRFPAFKRAARRAGAKSHFRRVGAESISENIFRLGWALNAA
jgi:hypothetical protein